MKKLALSVLLVVNVLPLVAQEPGSGHRIWLETGWGINFLGPAPHMADLMVDAGFDETTTGFLFTNGPIEHPKYNAVGPGLQLSFSHRLGDRCRIGILANYSGLREVSGYMDAAGHLFVRFTSISAIPLYTFEMGKRWETQAGPALMINKGNRSDSYHDEPESNFTKFSAGLHLGLNLKIWDSTLLYGKISSQCQLTYRNTMGPYTVVGWDDTIYSIPESKFGFSHVSILFIMGIHLPGRA